MLLCPVLRVVKYVHFIITQIQVQIKIWTLHMCELGKVTKHFF